jgi:hypothetical protein
VKKRQGGGERNLNWIGPKNLNYFWAFFFWSQSTRKFELMGRSINLKCYQTNQCFCLNKSRLINEFR